MQQEGILLDEVSYMIILKVSVAIEAIDMYNKEFNALPLKASRLRAGGAIVNTQHCKKRRHGK